MHEQTAGNAIYVFALPEILERAGRHGVSDYVTECDAQ